MKRLLDPLWNLPPRTGFLLFILVGLMVTAGVVLVSSYIRGKPVHDMGGLRGFIHLPHIRF